jgi:hypothetical protein
MSRSSTKREPWLTNQINAARKNLAEWPEWMKDVTQFNSDGGSTKSGAGAIKANAPVEGRKRK